jgi:hypothetical protein
MPFTPSNMARPHRSRSSSKKLNVKRPVNARPTKKHGSLSFSSMSLVTMASLTSPTRAARSSRGPRRATGPLRTSCKWLYLLQGSDCIVYNTQFWSAVMSNRRDCGRTQSLGLSCEVYFFWTFSVSERHIWDRASLRRRMVGGQSLYHKSMGPRSGCMAGLRTRYLELWEFLRPGIIADLNSKIFSFQCKFVDHFTD